jgi:Protein of unknown function (DUF3168)
VSIESQLFTALRGLVSDRVYPTEFPQPEGNEPPVWPALRFSIVSSVPVEDLCGDGDDTTADVTVQVDVVATTFDAMRALRLQVMAAMRTLPTPARLSSDFAVRDAETSTHRAVMTYEVSGSSDPAP